MIVQIFIINNCIALIETFLLAEGNFKNDSRSVKIAIVEKIVTV